MKHIIEFEMNGEDHFENQDKLRDIINVDEYKIFIWDLFQHLRDIIKYDEDVSEEVISEFEKLRDTLREDLRERNIEYLLEG